MLKNLWKPYRTFSSSFPKYMPKLIWQVLLSRGLNKEDEIHKWLCPSLKDITSPFLLFGIESAIDRLLYAYKKKENICIYADFDMDGTSGLALLKSGLELLGYENIFFYQPDRITEGYGIHSHVMYQLAEKKIGLIITVDVGITALDEIILAKELNIDVIVTDHHLPKNELPDAIAIIDPNIRECLSGLNHLSGVGVAFYLTMALKSKLHNLNLIKNDFNLKDLLDCFVIGTLADMVPLINENRVLVKHGLIELSKTKRIGLRKLLKELNLWGRPLNSQDVAIRFVPKLNALSRMGCSIKPIELFLTKDEHEADRLVKEVIACNKKRIELQNYAQNEAIKMLDKWHHNNFIWLCSPKFHKGVISLVATKLAQMYRTVCFVGSYDEDRNIIGSARMPENCKGSLQDILENVKKSLVKFGGHDMAAGFELKKEKADEFYERLNNFFNDNYLKESDSDNVLYYDGEGKLEEVNHQFMSWYDHLAPFGNKFHPPKFLFSSLTIKDFRELQGGSLKFKFNQDSCLGFDGIWFFPIKNHNFFQQEINLGSKIDILAEPQWNFFNGRKNLQLLIKDVRKT